MPKLMSGAERSADIIAKQKLQRSMMKDMPSNSLAASYPKKAPAVPVGTVGKAIGAVKKVVSKAPAGAALGLAQRGASKVMAQLSALKKRK